MESLTTINLIFCTAIVLAAYTVRGVGGFGSGVIALPLLALLLPLNVVVPVVTLLGVLAALGQGIKERRAIVWGELYPFLPGSLAGVFAGIYLFTTLNQSTVAMWMGVFVIAYALYSLLGAHLSLPRLTASKWWATPFGAIGAMVATLFGGMAGPIYVIYLDLRHLGKVPFRATVATLLLILGVVRGAAYVAAGIVDREVLLALGVMLAPMAAGMYIGDHIHIRTSEQIFKRMLGVLLIGTGMALLLKQHV